MLPKSVCKKIIMEGMKGSEYHVPGVRVEAVEYMIEKSVEFMQNVARNSVQELKDQRKHYVTKDVLQKTLNRLDLVLKNIPKA